MVVIGLVVVTGARDDSETDSGFEVLDGRSGSGSIELCGQGAARRVARVWFRGMSSGEPERVEAVTSQGKPVPRYVVTIKEGGSTRTLRIPGRTTAVRKIPELIQASDVERSLKITSVGVPPMAADIRSPLSGRLAGVEFRARVGETQWSGKMGVRCGNDSAYFASFAISDR